MAFEITVPEVSEGVTKGTVVSIVVKVGDRIEADQTLLELETDKALVAIPSPQAGTISAIKVKEGDQVDVGAVIMLLESEGKSAPEPQPAEKVEKAAGADESSGTDKTDETDGTDGTDHMSHESHVSQASQPAEPAPLDLTPVRRGEAVAPAAPSVRRLARELGVDIYQVPGSGSGGRISEDDIRGFVRQTMMRVTGGGAAPGEFRGLHAQRPLPDFSRWGEVRREKLSKVRELTADAMGYAWSTIPMVTQYDKAVVTAIEDYRNEFNYQARTDARLTMTAILVKICAAALRAFPQFNSSLDLAANELILKQSVHIGVAVDTPNGLLVPVLRDCERKGIEQLARELNELAAKTRERKVSPAEMEGGGFTISNLGGIGGQAFTPIVYAPQVAILGVSRAEMQPVWNGEEFNPQLVLPLALSYDHRVIDGADGARFLRWICETLENPLQLAMKG